MGPNDRCVLINVGPAAVGRTNLVLTRSHACWKVCGRVRCARALQRALPASPSAPCGVARPCTGCCCVHARACRTLWTRDRAATVRPACAGGRAQPAPAPAPALTPHAPRRSPFRTRGCCSSLPACSMRPAAAVATRRCERVSRPSLLANTHVVPRKRAALGQGAGVERFSEFAARRVAELHGSFPHDAWLALEAGTRPGP